MEQAEYGTVASLCLTSVLILFNVKDKKCHIFIILSGGKMQLEPSRDKQQP